jgi:hypothetical protein
MRMVKATVALVLVLFGAGCAMEEAREDTEASNERTQELGEAPSLPTVPEEPAGDDQGAPSNPSGTGNSRVLTLDADPGKPQPDPWHVDPGKPQPDPWGGKNTVQTQSTPTR